MSRLEAAKKTGAAVAVVWLFALALRCWPYATIATVSIASIYQDFRAQDKGPSDGSTR